MRATVGGQNYKDTSGLLITDNKNSQKLTQKKEQNSIYIADFEGNKKDRLDQKKSPVKAIQENFRKLTNSNESEENRIFKLEESKVIQNAKTRELEFDDDFDANVNIYNDQHDENYTEGQEIEANTGGRLTHNTVIIHDDEEVYEKQNKNCESPVIFSMSYHLSHGGSLQDMQDKLDKLKYIEEEEKRRTETAKSKEGNSKQALDVEPISKFDDKVSEAKMTPLATPFDFIFNSQLSPTKKASDNSSAKKSPEKNLRLKKCSSNKKDNKRISALDTHSSLTKLKSSRITGAGGYSESRSNDNSSIALLNKIFKKK